MVLVSDSEAAISEASFYVHIQELHTMDLGPTAAIPFFPFPLNEAKKPGPAELGPWSKVFKLG